MVYFKPVTGYLGLLLIKLHYEVVKRLRILMKTCKQQAMQSRMLHTHNQLYVHADACLHM